MIEANCSYRPPEKKNIRKIHNLLVQDSTAKKHEE
jgi:hypothetical protein